MEPNPVSQKNIVLVAIATVLVLAGAGAAWFFLRPGAQPGAVTSPSATVAIPVAPAGPVGRLPDPRIAVLDRNAILQYSKVGQDIMKQMQTFTNQARDRITGQRQALERDARQLQDQSSTLSAEAKQKRAEALQQRELALQNAAAREEAVLKNALGVAQDAVGKAMGPILEQVIKDRGVNLVMDRAAVPIASGPEFDITADIIAQLDAKITTYKVSLTPAAAAPAAAAPATP